MKDNQHTLSKYKERKEEISWATVYGQEMPCQREVDTGSKLLLLDM